MMATINENNISFSTPQRQAPAGLFIEAYKAIKQIYKLLGLYLAYVVIKAPSNKVALITGFIVFFILVLFYGWLRYRSILFHIDEEKEEFILQSGVFNKKSVVINLQKIQQVLISQHILQQLLKVYSVEISTAGSKKTEVSIHAMRLEDATELKANLLKRSTERSLFNTEIKHESSGYENPVKSHKLSTTTIFKIAITSRYGRSLALILAFSGAIYGSIAQWVGLDDMDKQLSNPDNWKLFLRYSFYITTCILIVWFLFNILSGLIRYYNYRIIFLKNTLQVKYGLVKLNNAIIYANKVQVFKVVQNYFQKRMNLSRVIFEQPSSNFAQDHKAIIEVPGCTDGQQKEFEHYIFGKEKSPSKVLFPSYRKLLPPLYIRILIPLILIISLHNLLPIIILYLFPVWAVAAAILDYYSYKHHQLSIGPDFILLQSGAWNISTQKIETFKVQAIKVTQRIWHKRAGIAHITIMTAASNLRVRFVKLEEIQPYINRWLYDIETSDRNWM